MRIFSIICAAYIAFSSATAAGADPLSAKRNVIAILAGELFVGEAEGHINGAGTVEIHAQRNPALTCVGQFASTPKAGGFGHLECSNGTSATLRFSRVTVLRGHGTGEFSQGPMSFTYGMAPEEASLYLTLPKGKWLVHSGSELTLADK